MTWTPLHEENGIFGNEAFDNFEQVYHVYVICPDERDARLRFFHDDEIRIWNNGVLVALRDGWNDVTEQGEDFRKVHHEWLSRWCSFGDQDVQPERDRFNAKREEWKKKDSFLV